MANQEEDRRRYPRSLQGLLQMAVNTSDDAESSTDSSTFASSVFQEMTEEVSFIIQSSGFENL